MAARAIKSACSLIMTSGSIPYLNTTSVSSFSSCLFTASCAEPSVKQAALEHRNLVRFKACLEPALPATHPCATSSLNSPAVSDGCQGVRLVYSSAHRVPSHLPASARDAHVRCMRNKPSWGASESEHHLQTDSQPWYFHNRGFQQERKWPPKVRAGLIDHSLCGEMIHMSPPKTTLPMLATSVLTWARLLSSNSLTTPCTRIFRTRASALVKSSATEAVHSRDVGTSAKNLV